MEPNRYVTTHLHFMLNKIHWFYFKKWKSNWQWSTRNVMWYSLNVLFQQQPAAALPESSFQLFMSIWIFLLFHIFLCWLLVLPFQDETNGLQHQYFFRIHVVILKMKNRSIWLVSYIFKAVYLHSKYSDFSLYISGYSFCFCNVKSSEKQKILENC